MQLYTNRQFKMLLHTHIYIYMVSNTYYLIFFYYFDKVNYHKLKVFWIKPNYLILPFTTICCLFFFPFVFVSRIGIQLKILTFIYSKALSSLLDMTSKMFHVILGNSLKFVNSIRTKKDEKETGKKMENFF